MAPSPNVALIFMSQRITDAPACRNVLQLGKQKVKITSKHVFPELHVKLILIHRISGFVAFDTEFRQTVTILKFVINLCLNLICKQSHPMGQDGMWQGIKASSCRCHLLSLPCDWFCPAVPSLLDTLGLPSLSLPIPTLLQLTALDTGAQEDQCQSSPYYGILGRGALTVVPTAHRTAPEVGFCWNE